MSWTASPNPDRMSEGQAQPLVADSRTLIEEIATAIAEAQAALFTGRIQDLETSIGQQRELCSALKALQNDGPFFGNSDPDELIATAQRVREQNLVLAALIRRIRSHRDALKNLLNGLSFSYHPKPVEVPGREG
jgi:flagellar biosynthesis/type III secretory pathway chaperone